MANRLGLESDISSTTAQAPSRHDARERKLAQTILANKNLEDTFAAAPIVSNFNNANGGVLPAEAASAAVIGFQTRKGSYELYYSAVESTGTAVYKVPTVSADGLEVPQDADHTDGPSAVEITNGTTARSEQAFVVGTDEPFFFEVTMTIDDISDLTELFCGFRKAAAYAADPDDYTDFAAFNIGKDADGQVEIHTALNNAATSETDTTLTDWADAGSHTLRVEVDRLGRATFKYDGSVPTVTQVYTFDSGDTVIPFLHVNGETGDAGVSISSWRCGKM